MIFPTIFGIVTIGSLLAFSISLIRSMRAEDKPKQTHPSETDQKD